MIKSSVYELVYCEGGLAGLDAGAGRIWPPRLLDGIRVGSMRS